MSRCVKVNAYAKFKIYFFAGKVQDLFDSLTDLFICFMDIQMLLVMFELFSGI
jgi:hypothetical protein